MLILTRRRLAAAAAAIVVLVLIGFYAGRSTKAEAPEIPPQPPPLPLGIDAKLSPQAQKEVEFLARGAMLYVFFHEVGHMAISELKIPATGPEEDVVDEFAAFVLTDALKAAPEGSKHIYAGIVYAGSMMNRLMAADRPTDQIDWTDEHSPDLRRYYNILCLATGADPLRFISIAVKDGVEQSRLQRCAEDYKMKHAAWTTLLEPHMPGFWTRLTGGNKLVLKVGEASKAEWLAFERAYTEGGYFQALLDSISTVIDLPQDIPVVVKACGQISSWWSPSDREITLCHDYFQSLTTMFAKSALAQANQQQAAGGQPAPGGGGQPVPGGGGQPVPGGGGQPVPGGGGQPGGGGGTPAPPAGGTDRPAAIVGTWSCQGSTSGMAVREQNTYEADGAFRSQTTWLATGVTMAAWGRWSVIGGNTFRIDVAGINPPTAIQNPLLIPFKMTGSATMQAGAVTCQKTGLP